MFLSHRPMCFYSCFKGDCLKHIPIQCILPVHDFALKHISTLFNADKKICLLETSTMDSSQPPWCSLPMAVMPICLETVQRMTCQKKTARTTSCGLVARRGCGGAPPGKRWRILSIWPEPSKRVTLSTVFLCSTTAQYVFSCLCFFLFC